MAEIIKNLGGDRIGSGNKNNIRLHNYERSTHNLTKRWKSTMAAGVLYPCYVNIALNGDTFDIDLDAACRTIPTQGPLFDTFKLQVDFYEIPLRLYNGLLHNNETEIGMKMEQVKFPMQILYASGEYTKWIAKDPKTSQIHPSSLMHYLGQSGVFGFKGYNSTYSDKVFRWVNATPILAYYDIFKNYYANKQEENAYVLLNQIFKEFDNTIDYFGYTMQQYPIMQEMAYAWSLQYVKVNIADNATQTWADAITFKKGTILQISTKANPRNIIFLQDLGDEDLNRISLYEILEAYGDGNIVNQTEDTYYIQLNEEYTFNGITATGDNVAFETNMYPFKLKNIDEMRRYLLNNADVNSIKYLDNFNKYPYKAQTDYIETNNNIKIYEISQPLQGLCVKTYQSDMFNNWVQTEWIDGENGINAITAIDTSNGNFTLDTLNLAQKVYNMLNRIAVSGGTYQDWQEAVYSEKAIRRAETPIYCGGMSSEVVFEEIISNTNVTNSSSGQEEPMGTLGGRGKLNGIRYGKLHIKINEPSIIMGIASLTPRITYTQGNKWYMTELKSYNDLHKPALDGIGFQDLMGEQMAWWASTQKFASAIDATGTIERQSIGKIPAWMNYMTDVDEAHGDFALSDGKSYMVLNRDYGMMWDGQDMVVTDFTTYIDPAKYNYAFAYTETNAQNFWVQVNMNIKARRKMSAKQIPNL